MIAGAEVFLATLLLVAAVLVVTSLLRLAWIDPGFDPEGVLTLTVPLPEARYPTNDQRLAVAEEIRDSLDGLPVWSRWFSQALCRSRCCRSLVVSGLMGSS